MSREPVMTQSNRAPVASGNLLLVPCTVPIGKGGDLEGWTRGAANFSLEANFPKEALAYFSPGFADGPRQVTFQERRESFSGLARVLFPKESGEQVELITVSRWWRTPAEDEWPYEYIPPVRQLELVVVNIPGNDDVARGVLMVHLGNLGGKEFDVDPGVYFSKLSNQLHDAVRKHTGRRELHCVLQKMVGKEVCLRPLEVDQHSADENNQIATVYPVITALELDVSRRDHMLLLRELATVTPSKKHGTQTEDQLDDRYNRAKEDLETPSGQWGVMVAQHGMAFASTTDKLYIPLRLYVSAMYADGLVTVLLRRAIASDLLQKVRKTNHEIGVDAQATDAATGGDRKVSSASALDTLLLLQQTLLWLSMTLSRAVDTETRTTKLLIGKLQSQQGVEPLTDTVERTTRELTEIAETWRMKQQRLEAEKAERSRETTNLLLAVIGLVAVPMTVIYTAIDLYYSQPPAALGVFWKATGVLLVILVALLSIWFTRRKESGNT